LLNRDFSKISVQTGKGGEECGDLSDQGGSIFGNFEQTSFLDGPYYMFFFISIWNFG